MSLIAMTSCPPPFLAPLRACAGCSVPLSTLVCQHPGLAPVPSITQHRHTSFIAGTFIYRAIIILIPPINHRALRDEHQESRFLTHNCCRIGGTTLITWDPKSPKILQVTAETNPLLVPRDPATGLQGAAGVLRGIQHRRRGLQDGSGQLAASVAAGGVS